MAQLLIALVLLIAGPQAAGTQQPQQPQAPLVTPGQTTYTVGENDVLKITVFGEPTLSSSYKVDSSGTINFPLIKEVSVGGKTTREIEAEIVKRLGATYFKNPQVTVEVEQARSRSIYIFGEVKQSGKYALPGEMTLLDMLALAGGVTQTASSQVTVLRPRNPAEAVGATLPDSQSSQIVATVNLDDLRLGKLVGFIPLEDGDTIYVAPAERVYVSGYVKNPGAYPIAREMTVQQAIVLAGGLTERGSNRGITIRREISPGKYDVIKAKLTDKVKSNDTIIVRQRFI